MGKDFNTKYGIVSVVYRFDPDTSQNGEGFYEMYDENDEYLGMLFTDNLDNVTTEDVEEQIDENLYL